MPASLDKPVILLAAHGERGGAANNQRLAQLVDAVGQAVLEADVGPLLVSIEGLAERTLAACGARPVVCLPLLFSDGFFYETRLKPHFAAPGRLLAEPLISWPGFASFLADNLAARLIASAADPRVVLVGHGRKSAAPAAPSRSAAAAQRLAGQMAARYGRITAGLLEEAPLARDAVAAAEPPYALIGLFFGAGLHGAEDFDVLASMAPERPAAAFTVGELPGLAPFIADRARRMLADLPAAMGRS